MNASTLAQLADPADSHGQLTIEEGQEFPLLVREALFCNVDPRSRKAFLADTTLPKTYEWRVKPISDFESPERLIAEAGSFPAKYFGAKLLLAWVSKHGLSPTRVRRVVALGCSVEGSFMLANYRDDGMRTLSFASAETLLQVPGTHYIDL
jgi:hypothetical protein